VLAAWFSDTIGIHAAFGAFILGVAMPRGPLARELTRQLEPITVAFFLPMFFTFSGLNTRLETVLNMRFLPIIFVVLLTAIIGKGVACWAAALLTGHDQRTALAVGCLMNARGSMGLIVLNLGLHKGVIEPTLFSIMVSMTILTTLMATPIFEQVYGRKTAIFDEA
jgi:Kef-type K+ transport system membrane component KefB